MLRGSMQRVGVVLVLAGALALATPRRGAAGSGWSGNLSGGLSRQVGLWERAMDWLGGWWGGVPSGTRGLTSMRGEQGMGIDPDGGHSPVAPGSSATNGGATPSSDQGAGIDPDGRR